MKFNKNGYKIKKYLFNIRIMYGNFFNIDYNFI